MVSKCCEAQTAVIDGFEWCCGCGKEQRRRCEWVSSYNCPSHYRRYPVYSRTKRFNRYLLELCDDSLFTHYNDIMDMFGKIEFLWGMFKKKRLYFFNKSCVLSFIVHTLQLDYDIKTLKDQARVDTQFASMTELLEKM